MTAAQYEMMRYKVPSVPQEVLWLRMFNLNLTKILEVTVSYQENTRERRTAQSECGTAPKATGWSSSKDQCRFFKVWVCVGEGWGILD